MPVTPWIIRGRSRISSVAWFDERYSLNRKTSATTLQKPFAVQLVFVRCSLFAPGNCPDCLSLQTSSKMEHDAGAWNSVPNAGTAGTNL